MSERLAFICLFSLLKEEVLGKAENRRVKKDIVKAHKYKWAPKDKIWCKKVSLAELDREKDWLTVAIYDSVFEGRVEEINLNDKYKL